MPTTRCTAPSCSLRSFGTTLRDWLAQLASATAQYQFAQQDLALAVAAPLVAFLGVVAFNAIRSARRRST
jgi:hypothetical protein